jgi:hypothetical protein
MTESEPYEATLSSSARRQLVAHLLAEGLWRLHHRRPRSTSEKSEKTTPNREKELESGGDPRLSGDVAVDGDERHDEDHK